ncbi:hypothetical protein EJ08DRAFT_660741 [Tothia fuscella]|uniref:Uncharacterized protein n=1 Tax=Tothia fuscella TaxID=1048955 RepID=A0A9P4NRW8_9PEZI|nr:hypothetical protein EJ08DRAFT_660741 [Tothia fuscella]
MATEATRTVFVTVTAYSSATSIPTLSPAQERKLKTSLSIAQWTAISVFTAYGLFTICLFSIWLRRRIKRRHEQPIMYSLMPEAAQSRGSFLIPNKGRVRRGTGASSYSVVSMEEQQRRTRSMFYEGPGTPVEEQDYSPPPTPPTPEYRSPRPTMSRPRANSKPHSLRYNHRYTSSQTNLIPLQITPPDSPPVPSLPSVPPSRFAQPPKILLDVSAERAITGRRRSSSQSRYYVPDTPPESMPAVPTITHQPKGSRGEEWQHVPL